MNNLHGTFQLNKEEKIHSWYPYLAGFSADFVREQIKKYNITKSDKIFDPFAGVGTTLLVSKMEGIHSEGIDVSPFASFVANTKLYLEYNEEELKKSMNKIIGVLKNKDFHSLKTGNEDKLIIKAFSEKILKKLLGIKEEIRKIEPKQHRDLFLLVLISLLKEVSNYKNFSPYLEQRKEPLEDAEVVEIFERKLREFVEDAISIENNTPSIIHLSDSREFKDINSKFDLVITSPPYLNNWDYSWITKIELLFMKGYEGFPELSRELRGSFIKSSTYLPNRETAKKSNLPDGEVKKEIESLVNLLAEERVERGSSSKKYDLMVTDYFNDIYLVLKELYKVMNKKSKSLWVVGDSALYGVHIPTDILIGKISKIAGFKFKGCEVLRKRRATRHNIPLRESVVIMEK